MLCWQYCTLPNVIKESQGLEKLIKKEKRKKGLAEIDHGGIYLCWLYTDVKINLDVDTHFHPRIGTHTHILSTHTHTLIAVHTMQR